MTTLPLPMPSQEGQEEEEEVYQQQLQQQQVEYGEEDGSHFPISATDDDEEEGEEEEMEVTGDEEDPRDEDDQLPAGDDDAMEDEVAYSSSMPYSSSQSHLPSQSQSPSQELSPAADDRRPLQWSSSPLHRPASRLFDPSMPMVMRSASRTSLRPPSRGAPSPLPPPSPPFWQLHSMDQLSSLPSSSQWHQLNSVLARRFVDLRQTRLDRLEVNIDTMKLESRMKKLLAERRREERLTAHDLSCSSVLLSGPPIVSHRVDPALSADLAAIHSKSRSELDQMERDGVFRVTRDRVVKQESTDANERERMSYDQCKRAVQEVAARQRLAHRWAAAACHLDHAASGRSEAQQRHDQHRAGGEKKRAARKRPTMIDVTSSSLSSRLLRDGGPADFLSLCDRLHLMDEPLDSRGAADVESSAVQTRCYPSADIMKIVHVEVAVEEGLTAAAMMAQSGPSVPPQPDESPDPADSIDLDGVLDPALVGISVVEVSVMTTEDLHVTAGEMNQHAAEFKANADNTEREVQEATARAANQAREERLAQVARRREKLRVGMSRACDGRHQSRLSLQASTLECAHARELFHSSVARHTALVSDRRQIVSKIMQVGHRVVTSDQQQAEYQRVAKEYARVSDEDQRMRLAIEEHRLDLAQISEADAKWERDMADLARQRDQKTEELRSRRSGAQEVQRRHLEQCRARDQERQSVVKEVYRLIGEGKDQQIVMAQLQSDVESRLDQEMSRSIEENDAAIAASRIAGAVADSESLLSDARSLQSSAEEEDAAQPQLLQTLEQYATLKTDKFDTRVTLESLRDAGEIVDWDELNQLVILMREKRASDEAAKIAAERAAEEQHRIRLEQREATKAAAAKAAKEAKELYDPSESESVAASITPKREKTTADPPRTDRRTSCALSSRKLGEMYLNTKEMLPHAGPRDRPMMHRLLTMFRAAHHQVVQRESLAKHAADERAAPASASAARHDRKRKSREDDGSDAEARTRTRAKETTRDVPQAAARERPRPPPRQTTTAATTSRARSQGHHQQTSAKRQKTQEAEVRSEDIDDPFAFTGSA